MTIEKSHNDPTSEILVWGAQLETGTEVGPYVRALALGGGVSSIAPIYDLTESGMLDDVSNGRLALRMDFCFDSLPTVESDFDIPLFTLREDADHWLTLRLKYDYEPPEGGASHWLLELESDSDSSTSDPSTNYLETPVGIEWRVWLKLYPDGSGEMKLVDLDNDQVEISKTISGFTWPDLTVEKIRLGCEVDGTGQRHFFIREIRTW